MDYTNMSLNELFEASDEVGDKYLTKEEIAKRDAELEAIAHEMTEHWGDGINPNSKFGKLMTMVESMGE